MLKLLVTAAFLWLLFKSLGFMFRLTWGLAKVVAAILLVLALPSLVVCLVFASGVILLIPILLMAAAAIILKVCI